MWQELLNGLLQGDTRSLARAISLIENEIDGYEDLLLSINPDQSKIVLGITGPPGAGKSTLVNCLIEELVKKDKHVCVLCVDPSSPFSHGSVLGDRIRMNDWYTHPNVYIRSFATRGSMGGLNHKMIEITELVKAAPFDYILIETVGVGQSEVEIAGLSDITIVVLVPEAGDEIQTMKSGLMEIADIFVINKADRPEADKFMKNLRLMLAPAFSNHTNEVLVLKTVATEKKGIKELVGQIEKAIAHVNKKHLWLLTEKCFQLIQSHRMRDVNKEQIKEELSKAILNSKFNLFDFVKNIGDKKI